MWWATTDSAGIYLGLRSACVQSSVGRGVTAPLWLHASSPADAYESAAQWVVRHLKRPRRRLSVDVQLSGALSRPFVFEPVQGLRSWREAQTVAEDMAPECTGLEAPCVVWLNDWQVGSACHAVAVSRILRDMIEQASLKYGLRLSALRPWWSAAVDEAESQGFGRARMLVAEDSDASTVMASGFAGSLDQLTTYAPKPEADQVRGLLARAALVAEARLEEAVCADFVEQGPVGLAGQADSMAAALPIMRKWS